MQLSITSRCVALPSDTEFTQIEFRWNHITMDAYIVMVEAKALHGVVPDCEKMLLASEKDPFESFHR